MRESNLIWRDMASVFIAFQIELNFIDCINHIRDSEILDIQSFILKSFQYINFKCMYVRACVNSTSFGLTYRYRARAQDAYIVDFLYITWMIVDNIVHEIIYSFNFVLRISTSFILLCGHRISYSCTWIN